LVYRAVAVLTVDGGLATIAVVAVSDQGSSEVVMMLTKLLVPAPRARSVPRPALVEALADVLRAPDDAGVRADRLGEVEPVGGVGERVARRSFWVAVA
jgi:hypothetical protein